MWPAGKSRGRGVHAGHFLENHRGVDRREGDQDGQKEAQRPTAAGGEAGVALHRLRLHDLFLLVN